LVNYYKILGLTSSATAVEIKAAFRALAKIYHPDKNPTGHEDFKRILTAYEVLSDPSKKYAYDTRLKYNTGSGSVNTNKTTAKSWTFEEKELRRRQYYNDHIKKYEKTSRAKGQHAELKKNYNEYKYILFATPLAVLLFLMIIQFSSSTKHGNEQTETIQEKTTSSLTPGDSPFANYFGLHVYDTSSVITLTIKNNSGNEVIVCLFKSGKFIRGCYLKNGTMVEIGQVPTGINEIRYLSGVGWDPGLEYKNVNVLGGFTKNTLYYSAFSETLSRSESLTLTSDGVGFEKIGPEDFFKKN
jgi:curved DNA-binding protein CbpA